MLERILSASTFRPISRAFSVTQVFRGYTECCLRYKINGKIGIRFCFGSCGFKKEQGYSLRDIKY